MFTLIGIIIAIIFFIWYVTTIDFVIGNGFTEKKKKAKDVEYTETSKEDEKIALKEIDHE